MRPTITIGIPAYNEENNIEHILKELHLQHKATYTIDTILVVSDGSTDSTVNKVKSLQFSHVRVIDNPTRQGRAAIQNFIIRTIKSDIFVLIDADTQIQDPYFIQKLIEPIALGNADLTSARITPLPSQHLIDRILSVSMKYKNYVFSKINNGCNVYAAYGPARAFSKRLYSTIYFPISIGEDAFSFLFCVQNNFVFRYVPSAQIFYKLPTSFADHSRQSIRAFRTQDSFTSTFGKHFVKTQYAIPFNLMIMAFTRFFLIYPFEMTSYAVITIYLCIASCFSRNNPNSWTVASSSKKLTRHT